MSTYTPSFSHLISEIVYISNILDLSDGLYVEGKEPFVTAIAAARDACGRAQKAVHQVCGREGVGWPANALVGFKEEVELLDQLIKNLAIQGHLLTEDEEAAEIAKAISDAKAAIAEARDIVVNLAIPNEATANEAG